MTWRARAFSGEVGTGSPWKMRPNQRNQSMVQLRTIGSCSRAAAPAGFTLIEMIVVLGVLALVMGLAAGLGRSPGGAQKMRFAANEIAAALRLGRSGAIINGRKSGVSFDLA